MTSSGQICLEKLLHKIRIFCENCAKKGDKKETLTAIFAGMVKHAMKTKTVKPVTVNKSELFLLDSGASCHVI